MPLGAEKADESGHNDNENDPTPGFPYGYRGFSPAAEATFDSGVERTNEEETKP